MTAPSTRIRPEPQTRPERDLDRKNLAYHNHLSSLSDELSSIKIYIPSILRRANHFRFPLWTGQNLIVGDSQ